MSLIRKPFELKTTATIKALVYGQPGIGKSTIALSAPKPLFLDFDGGVHRVNPLHQTDTVQIEKWEDVEDVLAEDLRNYETFVIDTAGKMLDFMDAFIIKGDPKMGRKDGALSLQGYGARKMMFRNFLKKVSIMGKHLVFVAHDKEEGDRDNKIIRPEIGGSSSGDLIKELDLVGYMEAVGKERTISFDPCEKFYGKNTCQLEAIYKVPDVSAGGNDFMTRIIAKWHEGLEHRRVMASAYSDLIELISGNLEDVKDAAGLNQFLEWAKGLQHVWDSKLQAGIRANAKAKELGLKFNRETMVYEPITASNVQAAAPVTSKPAQQTPPESSIPAPAQTVPAQEAPQQPVQPKTRGAANNKAANEPAPNTTVPSIF